MKPGARPLRSLGDLASLKREIELRRRADDEARQQARRRGEDALAFAASVGPVTALAAETRAAPPRRRPAPEPVQRRRDEAQALRESISDEFDVDSLLETDAGLSYRRPGIGPDVLRKLRRGGWVVQREVDLHGLRRDAAREALGAFLREAERLGLRCVRVVHGKGLGSPGREPVLKHRVHGWLVQQVAVLAYVQARPAEGGSGALVVLLRPTGRAG